MATTGQGDLLSIKKKITKEETLLDQVSIRMNVVSAGNKVVIKKIDSLRKERSLFDQIYKQLELEISHKRRILINTIKEFDRITFEKK